MKVFVFAFALLCVVSAEFSCDRKVPDVPKDWLTMVEPCTKRMRNQIQEELKASIKYLAMAAHFSRDTVNRPGFAKLFFEAASEEREHAIKLINYLLMRGELTSGVSKLISRTIEPDVTDWESGVAALKDALRLEAAVTAKIRDVIQVCENSEAARNWNDYHLVDYLTGDFLEEQYRGQRDLAGKISTLDKLMTNHGPLGEFLFDKKLLSGEL